MVNAWRTSVDLLNIPIPEVCEPPQRWAYIYGRDGKLLLVCPAAESHLHWPCACVHRLEVRPASAPATDR